MMPEPARDPGAPDEAQRQAVLAELDRILTGAAFRGTRRSQEFLRFVVMHALNGQTECLKERSIGIEVFGRPVDYDTGDDSIVRVKASEVRKRLAQHYRETGPSELVQIDLPPGAYAPEFRFCATEPEPGPPIPRRRVRRWAIWAAVVAASAVAAAAFLTRTPRALEEFWRPVFRSSRPVLLCVAHPAVYRLSGASRMAFEDGKAPESVPRSEIARDTEHYVGFGDALALANLASFFTRSGKAAQLRIGNDVTFADLRGSPSVLIGAVTNQWTMEITNDLRFAFERVASGVVIRDRLTSRTWSPAANKDFAVVTRIFNSKSGEMAIAAAGLSHFGTQMSGEFLIDAAGFEAAMQQAPPDWRTRNLQLVLEADVIGRTPGPPRLVASYFW